MIGIDTNILVDLAVCSSSFHEASTEKIKTITDDLYTTPTNLGE